MLTTIKNGGRRLADRLNIPIVGKEGRDLKCACISCSSSDAGRIHEDTGFFHCYSCGKNLMNFDLAKLMVGHDEARRVMVEVGFFESDWGMEGNGRGAATIEGGRGNPALVRPEWWPAGKAFPPPAFNRNSNGAADSSAADEAAFLEVCRLKRVPPDAWRKFGATAAKGGVVIPMYGPDKLVSSAILITPNNGKGKYATGKKVGLFLPGRFPVPGESWLIVEGPKDAAALTALGYPVCGLPGNRMHEKFAPLFTDVNVTVVPDVESNGAGENGAVETIKRLQGVARSIRKARLPVAEGDTRDALEKAGEEAVRTAIDAALILPATGNAKAPEIPPPTSLRQLVSSYPSLRPAVIDGLLRVGETMNIIASPKAKKSWLVHSLALSVASGRPWLKTFACNRGRVLIIDGELHREVISHRMYAVAEAMRESIEPDVFDWIDVEPLRGVGADLLNLAAFIERIEPGRYSLVVLDAWYRFLPPGYSENDNAQVMALYNRIDAYAERLKSAWVNVHHASKGDQSGKSTTDVGSGAGSQSRAADTHLIIRPHKQADVAVIEAVVRSLPPVDRLAIRWSFPVWEIAADADPRQLDSPQQNRARATQDQKEIRLEDDRKAVVAAMVRIGRAETKTLIRDAANLSGQRFGPPWASLLIDKTVIEVEVVKGNGRSYPGFVLSGEGTEE